MYTRSYQLVIILSLVTFVIYGRVLFFQLWKAPGLRRQAEKEHYCVLKLQAPRGRILDRKGRVLATNREIYSVYIVPRLITSPAKVRSLLKHLGVNVSYEKLHASAPSFYAKHNLSPSEKGLVRKRRVKGVFIYRERERVYPYGDFAGGILGFVGKDYTGMAGVEYEMDRFLKGKDGWIRYRRRSTGKLVYDPEGVEEKVRPGLDVVLTIDADLQSMVEGVLSEACEQYSAKGGVVIVVAVNTGEILAMANYPSCDPVLGAKSDLSLFRNRAIVDLYEPGSTIKIVPAAMYIMAGFSLSDTIDDGSGSIRVGGRVIKDAEKHPPFTFVEAFTHSSNTAFVKIGNMFPKERFYRMVKRLGIGVKTGIDWPYEPEWKAKDISKIRALEYATSLFGQGIACTPLQLAFAYQAIANDGVLLQPILISEVRDKKGRVVLKRAPCVVRRVLPKGVCRVLKELLEGVVEEGTGYATKIEGLRIGGKTGTSQKCSPTGGYDTERVIASFVGFFPVHDPKFLVYVMIDEPMKGHYGSEVAVPTFREIVERMMVMEGYREFLCRPAVAMRRIR